MQNKSLYYKKSTKRKVNISFGFLLCLFSLFASLNYGFVSTGLTYVSALVFGNLYFVPFLFLFIFGILLILNKTKFLKIGILNYLGIFFTILVICVFLSLYSNNEISGFELRNNNFSAVFLSSLKYESIEPINVFTLNIGGGYIGFSLVGVLNSATNGPVLSFSIGSLLIVLMVFCFSFKPIYSMLKNKKKSKNDSKLKEIDETKESENVSQLIEDKTLSNDSIEEVAGQIENNINKASADEQKEIFELKSKFMFDKEPEQKVSPIFNEEIKHENEITPKSDFHDETIYNQNDDIKQKSDFSFPDSAFNFQTTVIARNELKENQTNPVQTEKEISNEDNIIFSNGKNDVKKVDENAQFDISNTQNASEKNNEFVSDIEEDNHTSNIINDHNIEKEDNNQTVKIDPTISKRFEETDIFNNQSEESATENTLFDGNTFDENKNRDINKVDKEDDEAELKPEYMEPDKYIDYKYPSIDLLPIITNEDYEKANLEYANSKEILINKFFEEFSIPAIVEGFEIGPSVTRYNIKFTEKGQTFNLISKKTLELSSFLGGIKTRFEPIVPGKACSGIEIKNKCAVTVSLREVYENMPPKKEKSLLYFPVGKNITGECIFETLEKAVHLLICGSTGSGKSVFENQLIVSLLMRLSPNELKMIMIDPKQVELAPYDKIPHLICPVINDNAEALLVLKKLCEEMDARYSLLKTKSVTSLEDYNACCIEEGERTLPNIVVVIDEFADLMILNKDIEIYIARLCQTARACGIHLILVTQRPSKEVISGVIKANFDKRVILKVTDSINSRVALDQEGAESLFGNGDLLLKDENISQQLTRLQSPYISTKHIKIICNYLKNLYPPDYDPNFLNLASKLGNDNGAFGDNFAYQKKEGDSLEDIYNQVLNNIFLNSDDFISQSKVQRMMSIGFNRAGKIIDKLVKEGVAEREYTPGRGNKILINCQEQYNDAMKEREEFQNSGSIS